jgi:hypothetical protein
MRGSNHGSASAEAWALAARQHGVIARRQLLELGLSSNAVDRRIRNGRLHVLWPGVYAVGRAEVTRLGLLMSAVLACRPGAFLSDESAAELWGIRPGPSRPIHVSVREVVYRGLEGIRIHRRASLPENQVTEHLGIPVTDPVQTLIDIATHLSPAELEAAVNEADKRDLLDPEELRTKVSERLPANASSVSYSTGGRSR